MRNAFASFLIVFLTSQQATAAAAAAISDPHLEQVKNIFAWVNDAEDGFVSEKQSVRRMVENDLDTPLIVYATEDIEKGELLVQTPWSHILNSDDPQGDAQAEWYCGTAKKLSEEMKKGADSFYAPYVEYINSEPDNQLPSQYSRVAQLMLLQIVESHPDEINRGHVFSRDDTSESRLMPEDIDVSKWTDKCGGNASNKRASKAASMVVQRADDMILIPAYDAYNHRNNDFINGKEYMNARSHATIGEYHQSFALRDIKKGEQIYISYNMCEQCYGRSYSQYGTAEMFRDYGFVEWFPQRWWYPGYGDYHFEDNTLEINQFNLFENEDTKDLTLLWTHLTEDNARMDRFKIFLTRELRRLKRLKNIDWAELYIDEQWKKLKIAPYEWDNINQFLDANIVAMTLALKDLDSPTKPLIVSPEELKELLADTNHYDSLETAEPDDLAYYKYTCDNSEFFEFLGYIDTEEAFFTDTEQLLGYFESFFFNKDKDDVNSCLDINNTVQICSNFRPYHHEYMAHVAARYVQSVKRVAIIGNGHSMLLHEVLKYPDLELVMNLELDQTVTRKSFKHFKVDPHFHDSRVDWWFGDVTKSLLVLPESYWESFDLVLIDLPASVLEVEVTQDLDVLAALSKLVNPETGIIVENELNLPRLDESFDHSMELYYRMPSVCSNTLSFGSNAVDFFHAPIYDHGISSMGNLLYQSSPKGLEDRHDMLHHYRTKACSNVSDDKTDSDDKDDGEEMTSHGVLEFVTLEQLESFPKSMESVVETTKASIEGIGGFTFVENAVHFDNEQLIAWIVMQEGYVVARIQSNENAGEDADATSYLGFDIQVWSQIDRLAELKNAIEMAFESKHASSHKVVVGGMFGKEDGKQIGPLSAKSSPSKCSATPSVESSSFDVEAVGKVILEEVFRPTNSDEAIVAIFCGKEGDSCSSFDLLKMHDGVKEAVPIYDCAAGKTTEDANLCEQSIVESLRSRGKRKRLHMLVFDGGASQEMHQIAHSIFDTYENRELLLMKHTFAVTWPSKLGETPWRREFLDRFRKQVHHDPVRMGEFEIISNGEKYSFGVVSTNDATAAQKFDLFEESLQSRLAGDATVQLRNMHGGLYKYTGEEPHVGEEFREKHYDKTVAEAHFREQVPLAVQTILQYEGNDQMKEQSSQGIGMDCNFVEKLVYGSAMGQGLLEDPEKQMLYRYNVGDGCVVMMLGEAFNIVSVWDGKVHLDVNFFAESSGESTASSSSFDEKLRGFSPFVEIGTDTQPRGLGRVVNFAGDLVTVDRMELGRQLMTAQHEEEKDYEYEYEYSYEE
eukprot:CAMPEP_0116118602 /NCGR_PEP_ID=MMETSP0329-20121206/2191_1 /TAXON_ID=697910 /ORGANISM="Pseudo-nitzschia arenysensis, Strain B593" /LENGTH=1298 /DNA_ID=CAMNT_0003612239 /DNA_START=43 /DNA_END=3939 /DNA_ORIENTATION=+